ncbi:MAG: hypothetical protein DPW18_06455 [Chloroflexi bacterium]|nr:hypothetical protein [Chloroflexota bacterium]
MLVLLCKVYCEFAPPVHPRGTLFDTFGAGISRYRWEINNRNPTGKPGLAPVCEVMRNTAVILTTRFFFVNDNHQPEFVPFVLVELSDKSI